MPSVTLEDLTKRLELAHQLQEGRKSMLEPQDLPGRYGRVVKAVDQVLKALDCISVLAGGWAVWRHGYVGRVTEDIDIVIPADRIEEFMKTAGVAGFEVLPTLPGRWPKLRHKETQVKVDLLPEGGRPGTPAKPAPTLIPHPKILGATGAVLVYITLPALIELKLAAGRARDESDIVELIRTNEDQIDFIRNHLANVHADYLQEFDRLAARARDQRDE